MVCCFRGVRLFRSWIFRGELGENFVWCLGLQVLTCGFEGCLFREDSGSRNIEDVTRVCWLLGFLLGLFVVVLAGFNCRCFFVMNEADRLFRVRWLFM